MSPYRFVHAWCLPHYKLWGRHYHAPEDVWRVLKVKVQAASASLTSFYQAQNLDVSFAQLPAESPTADPWSTPCSCSRLISIFTSVIFTASQCTHSCRIESSQHGLRQVLPDQPDLLYDQVLHLVDEGKAVNVSTWTAAKPLTTSPTAASWKSCGWLLRWVLLS